MRTVVCPPTGTCADDGDTTIGGWVGAGLGDAAAGEALGEGAGTCPRASSSADPAAQTKTEAAATIAASGFRSIFRLRDFGYFAAHR